MLARPEKGFHRSVNKNNVDPIILGDWAEATTLFARDELSISDIVDFLGEQNICEKQDLAHEIAGEGWREMDERGRHIGPTSSIALRNDGFARLRPWDEDVARSFLVLLSLLSLYPDWADQADNAVERGTLFERLVHFATREIFPRWDIIHAGWSPHGPKAIEDVVGELNSLLATTGSPAEIQKWAGRRAKDAGLDLACSRTFADFREGTPLYLMQCASGRDWVSKLTEPSTNLWQKLLNSSYQPLRILAIPFVVDADEMRRKCTVIEGPLLDRNRLLSAYRTEANWLPPDLADDLRDWLRPRIETLPRA